MDGADEDEYGRERYWHCEEPAVRTVTGPHGTELRVCARHAEELGEGEREGLWITK
jgi:hypothetical protein